MDSLGLLKIRVLRAFNLAVRDTRTSDPYVVVQCGPLQRVKTQVVNDCCNPIWNEELTISIKDLNVPITLYVYDEDTLTFDDKMGNACIDVKPYIECLKMGLKSLSDGSKVERVTPTRENCLAEESCVAWNKAKNKMVQEMILRLRNVESGEVQIQLEWLDLPGTRGLGNIIDDEKK